MVDPSNQSPQSLRSEPTSRPAGLHLKKRTRLSHDRGPPHDISDISRVTSVGANAERAADKSKTAFAEAIELCRTAQVKFDTRSAFGLVADMINKIAAEIEADQIVMGTRGFSAFEGIVLGSVSTKVIQMAHIPITLVK